MILMNQNLSLNIPKIYRNIFCMFYNNNNNGGKLQYNINIFFQTTTKY